MSKVFKRLCSECKSEDILIDAKIRWLPSMNDWDVECDYDTFTCEACGYEGAAYKYTRELSLEEKIYQIDNGEPPYIWDDIEVKKD